MRICDRHNTSCWGSQDRRRARDRGASLVEYGLLIALIALVCLAAVTFMGESNSSSIDKTASTVGSAIG